jgi:Uma2 family endonuclease
MATAEQVVSTDEFIRLADSAPDWETLDLVRGRVRHRTREGTPKFSSAIARIGHALANWLDDQRNRVGVVAGGGGLCRIAREPDTIVGVDVAYYQGVEFVETSDWARFFDDPPVVAVEVLSATDEHEDVVERIRDFLAVGVKQVWVADPDFRSITVHRPGVEHRLFTRSQELDGEPELPGFRCVVESLFVGKRKAGQTPAT